MKPEAQRIAIVKACGWTLVGINATAPVPVFSSSQLTGRTPEGYVQLVPYYLDNLNEMHAVEETIANDPLKVLEYYRNLVDLIDRAPDGSRVFGKCVYWETLHASAAQRAEAFLRTLNLWTDE